jgi:hypothetical protein
MTGKPDLPRDQDGALTRSVRRRQGELRTEEERAILVELDPAYLGELERGRANISVLALTQLGRALGVTASWRLNSDG